MAHFSKKNKKEKKLSPKQQKKAEENRRKQIKTTLDWMEIEEIQDDRIILKEKNEVYVVRGIQVSPLNIYMFSNREQTRLVNQLSNAIDLLYRYTLYFKFVKSEPDTIMYTNDLLQKLKHESNPAISKMIQMQIDKFEFFRQNAREVKFYILIQEPENKIDNAYEELSYELSKVWKSHSGSIKPMNYLDYKALVMQEFNNPMVEEFYFSRTESEE